MTAAAAGTHETEHGGPEFTLVVTTLNDEAELPRLIDSVERQSVGHELVEVVLVDLGSTDGTRAVVAEWVSRARCRVSVHEADDLGDARNIGIATARGTWITFPEPGAQLDGGYLDAIRSFARRQPDAVVVAAASWTADPHTDTAKDNHPLRSRFAGGNQVVDLDRFPEYFHRSLASAFLRTEVIRNLGLQATNHTFGGSVFVTRYLLGCPRRLVGFVASARYVRPLRMADGVAPPQRVLDSGTPLQDWQSLLDTWRTGTGSRVPEWAQRAALDTLAESLSDDARARGGRNRLAYADRDALRSALAGVVAHIDGHVLNSYSSRGFRSERRHLLSCAVRGEDWHTPYVVATKYDRRRRQVRVAYRYTGEPVAEHVLLRGKAVQPVAAKTRDCEYFGHTLMFERIIWLPASGAVRILLDGVPVEVRQRWEGPKALTSRPAQLSEWFAPLRPATDGASSTDSDPRERARRHLLRAAARSSHARRLFHDAWVLMDRMHEADDNGERLFEYLREHRRDINAWFVVEQGTPDWRRLRGSGHRDRVVAYGSFRWHLLMLNCSHLASSHVHESIRRPAAITAIAPPTWHFTFLQHGVIKDDISRWVNKLDVDLFITSTPDEHASIVADHTPYAYTAKEVAKTGLPRFDRLRRMAEQVRATDRRYILVCPTWRDWLCKPMVPGTQVRPLVDDFLDSDYVRTWMAFLNDPQLVEYAKRRGLTVGFMPHPNFQTALEDVQLPDGIEVLTYAGNDVQDLIAKSAVMVTDYSSIAFNAAYIDQAVVYLQFDAEHINSGAHNYRPGYFDYERDGFGPVVEKVDDAVAATLALCEAEQVPPHYQERIDRAFPDRSGSCCARVTAAIEASGSEPSPDLAPRIAGARRVLVRTAARRLSRHPRLHRVVRAVRARRRR